MYESGALKCCRQDKQNGLQIWERPERVDGKNKGRQVLPGPAVGSGPPTLEKFQRK